MSCWQVSEDMQLRQEVTRIEEERIQMLNNIEELEQKIRDLDTQMDESLREVCLLNAFYMYSCDMYCVLDDYLQLSLFTSL